MVQVGLISHSKNKINHLLKKENNIILQIGKTFGHLHQSVFFDEIHSMRDGPPPEINLANEKNNGETILKLLDKKMLSSVHDVSAGGLLLALAEMSISSNYGLKIEKPKTLFNLIEYFFGEDQGRYIIEVESSNIDNVKKILKENNVFSEIIATVQKDNFEIIGEFKMHVKDLCTANNKWYNNY